MKTRKVVSLIRWSSAILILGALSLIANPPAGAAAGAACQGLKGTFLQLTEVQSARPAAEWRQLFDELRTIGINTLFLQWTVLDRKPLFPTARNETGANTPLGSILDLAAQSGIRVWFGLALDSSYWEEIKQPADLLRPYFRRRLQDLAGFLDDLNAATAGAPFAGWYIPDEIDDRTWLDPGKRAVLKKYLTETVALLRARRPGSKVAISGFSNSFADPDLLASFWVDVIRASGIDLLLFQDGVGEGKVALENIGLYYGALDRAVRSEASPGRGGEDSEAGPVRRVPSSRLRDDVGGIPEEPLRELEREVELRPPVGRGQLPRPPIDIADEAGSRR